jgi:hypothetical protein
MTPEPMVLQVKPISAEAFVPYVGATDEYLTSDIRCAIDGQ